MQAINWRISYLTFHTQYLTEGQREYSLWSFHKEKIKWVVGSQTVLSTPCLFLLVRSLGPLDSFPFYSQSTLLLNIQSPHKRDSFLSFSVFSSPLFKSLLTGSPRVTALPSYGNLWEHLLEARDRFSVFCYGFPALGTKTNFSVSDCITYDHVTPSLVVLDNYFSLSQ